MWLALTSAAVRFRILISRWLVRFGLRDDSFLVVLATLIGIITSLAAVGFHGLTRLIGDGLYKGIGPDILYQKQVWLIALLPAIGGLGVGLIQRYWSKTEGGHGIIDVIVSVIRSTGFVKPSLALQTILTSSLTLGTGGSTGAEGPIVQIGAAIATGIGQFFRIARQHMPILIGCGSAAGISAIFNAPIGGVLFTLEVILFDFSLRTFTPVVVASVIANVTTQGLMGEDYRAIFALPSWTETRHTPLEWGQLGNFAVLGLLAGGVGVLLLRTLHRIEALFHPLRWLGFFRPAIGGLVVGLLGVIYIVVFGWVLFDRVKPFPFSTYPMPAFFGDGYGIIRMFLDHSFYADTPANKLLLLLIPLFFLKIFATGMTLGSGGSGGVIAPALFLGATLGAILGIVLQKLNLFGNVQPEVYAVVGMGAVLAAVLHAPLASILIVVELTQDNKIMVPAMFACVLSTGTAKALFRDSVYTHALRGRGVSVGSSSDLSVLRRMNVEQVPLEPAVVLKSTDPLQHMIDLLNEGGTDNFAVLGPQGLYAGMIASEDLKLILLQREAIPLLTIGELMRVDLPLVQTSDDLATVMDIFSNKDVGRLCVGIASSPGRIVGMISRAGLMRVYQERLSGQ